MSSDDSRSLDSLQPSADQRAALEREEQRRLEELAAEVAQRYDPERLGRLSASAAGRAEKLDDDTRRRMEARLGSNFSDVRVVRGAFADRVTQRHNADAVTVGSTGVILMRDAPRTNLRSPEGRALLAHELTHVKQAKQGMHFALEQGSSGAEHEQAAERVEASVLNEERGHPGAPGEGEEESPDQFRRNVVQRVLSDMVNESTQNSRRGGR